MTKLYVDLSVSLDGYVAGPSPSLQEPLGEGGEALHDWAFATKAFRARHGMEGGEDGVDSQLAAEGISRSGATIMGRRMFSGGAGPWANDPKADGWWGDDPPFHHPVFVLTHHARKPLVKKGGTTFTFVTDGVAAALEQARAAAGERDVQVGGGAQAARACLTAGLVDELHLHIAPILLGGGTRLFDGPVRPQLECRRVVQSPSGVAHVSYDVVR